VEIVAGPSDFLFPPSPTSGMVRGKNSSAKLKSHCFIGVSLGGGKSDKTCIAVLEYFPEHEKVFLSRLYEKISDSRVEPADNSLIELLSALQQNKPVDTIAIDVPLTLPPCIPCRLKCPGYEKCKVSEVQWMHRQFQKRQSQKKRPNKHFTPYTQRSVEIFIEDELEEKFHPSEALGANAAPLTARAQYLQKRLGGPMIEVFPRLSTWRIGLSLKVGKSHLRHYRHSAEGEASREVFLKALVEKNVAFVYQQDIRAMVGKHSAFEAFISGLTAYLKFRGQSEKRPKSFPRGAAWIEFPKADISW
jgi:hypothetical protein